jgi:RNA polymerase-associated protein LEO1
MDDEGQYEKDMQPDDDVADEDMRYESDDNRELKTKEKPVGPPLDLVVPFKQPPAQPDKVSYYCHMMILHFWPHTVAVLF